MAFRCECWNAHQRNSPLLAAVDLMMRASGIITGHGLAAIEEKS